MHVRRVHIVYLLCTYIHSFADIHCAVISTKLSSSHFSEAVCWISPLQAPHYCHLTVHNDWYRYLIQNEVETQSICVCYPGNNWEVSLFCLTCFLRMAALARRLDRTRSSAKVVHPFRGWQDLSLGNKAARHWASSSPTAATSPFYLNVHARTHTHSHTQYDISQCLPVSPALFEVLVAAQGLKYTEKILSARVQMGG